MTHWWLLFLFISDCPICTIFRSLSENKERWEGTKTHLILSFFEECQAYEVEECSNYFDLLSQSDTGLYYST